MIADFDVPLPEWWISHLTDGEYELLVRPLLDSSRVGRPWVELALVHPSYLNEEEAEVSQRDRARLLLRAIDQAGAATLDLALAQVSIVDAGCTTPAEANAVVQAVDKSQLVRAIADRFALIAHSVYGRGGLPPGAGGAERWERNVGNAFLGACAIHRHQNAVSLIRELIDGAELLRTSEKAYKNRLQEATQEKWNQRPAYTLVEATGPDHQPWFRVAASIRGSTAEGEGRSMRRAEEAAARALFLRLGLAVDAGKAAGRPPAIGSRFEFEKLSARDRLSIEDFAVRLGLRGSAQALSRAFVHSSFVHENGLGAAESNATLAFLGSAVLGVWAARLQLRELVAGEGDESLETLTISPWNVEACAKAARSLALEGQLLVGRGIGTPNEKLLAESFQALLGALFIELGEPDAIAGYVAPAVLSLRTAFDVGWIDAKSRLIRRLVPSGIELTFDYEETGPHHDAKFVGHVTMRSTVLGRSLRVRGNEQQQSRRAAEKATAAAILRALAGGLNSQVASGQRSSAMGEQEFVARHECLVAPRDRADALAWFGRGALGTAFLKSDQPDSFLAWSRLLEGFDGTDEERLERFYRACGESAPSMSRVVIMAAGHRLIEWVNGLGIDPDTPSVRHSKEFQELMDLNTLVRLSASPTVLLNIRAELEGYALLHRPPNGEAVMGDVPDAWIMGCEGGTAVALSRVVHSAWPDRTAKLSLNARSAARSIEVRISCAQEPSPITSLGQADTLFASVGSMLGIIDVNTMDHAVVLTFRSVSNETSLGSRLLDAYRSPSGQSDPERTEIARVLHDLKNEVLAYDSSLRQWSNAIRGSTASLGLQYQAGHHLDAVRALATSLGALTSAFVLPAPEEFDFVLFLREYLAQKILSIPASVRLVTPYSAVPTLPVYMPRDYLQSVLDNLIKNSIEAMPSGGEIRLDWAHVPEERTVILDLLDTGEGLDAEQVAAFRKRTPVATTKVGGSALGLATVRGMVHRMGGEIDLVSSPGVETRWTLTLPDWVGGRE